jgi:hypothetical protein
MAAYLLNVRLALHPENVPIACGRNVVAGGFLSMMMMMMALIECVVFRWYNVGRKGRRRKNRRIGRGANTSKNNRQTNVILNNNR